MPDPFIFPGNPNETMRIRDSTLWVDKAQQPAKGKP
jgi:hypothetical protein